MIGLSGDTSIHAGINPIGSNKGLQLNSKWLNIPNIL